MSEIKFYRESDYDYGWKSGALMINSGEPIQVREDGLIWRSFDVYLVDLDSGVVLDKVNSAVLELDEEVEPPELISVLRINKIDNGDSFSDLLMETFRQLTDTD